LSLAIGYAILMKFTHSAVCLALAAMGAVVVSIWFKKEVKRLKEQPVSCNAGESSE